MWRNDPVFMSHSHEVGRVSRTLGHDADTYSSMPLPSQSGRSA
jgi:hypothetical protein